MLIEFSVENFLSFKEKTTFSMVANPSENFPEYYDKEHDIEITNDNTTVLPVMAIYGANASGKSNLIRGLGKIVGIAQGDSVSSSSDKYYFLFGDNYNKKPSALSIKFHVKKTKKTYNYEVKFDNNKIFQETLQELSTETQDVIYNRILLENKADLILNDNFVTEDTPFYKYQFNKNIEIFNDKTKEKLKKEFLNKVTRNKSLLARTTMTMVTDDFKAIRNLFRNISVMFPKDINEQSLKQIFETYLSNSDEKINKITEFIKYFNVDIDSVEMAEINPKDFISSDTIKQIDDKIAEDMEALEEILKRVNDISTKNSKKSQKNPLEKFINMGIPITILNGEYVVFFTLNGTVYKRLSYITRGVKLNDRQVSDGTKRLLDFIPLLEKEITKENKNNSTIFIVDEMDNRLHPQLMKHLLSNFIKLNKSKEYTKSKYTHQLIFTTHDAGLLSGSVKEDTPLRPDEIAFVVKNSDDLSTSIQNLSQHKDIDKIVRTDLRTLYLEGYLNGVPKNMTNIV